jgi:hypothetical protein
MPSVMSASRPAALMRGPSAKPKSKARPAAGRARPRRTAPPPRLHAAGAHALQALRDQPAVVGVQLHHVGHRAQRHQVQQAVQPRLPPGGEAAALAQLGTRGQQHVEHHADPASALLAKPQPGWLGLTMTSASGSTGWPSPQRRQVVVGDQHLQAAGARMGDAGLAGDAVVHRDQQRGLPLAAPGRRWPASGRSRAPPGRAPRSPALARRPAAGPRSATAQAVAPSQS